jgi:alpha-glucosidase
MDIGGFSGNPSQDLYIRWMQLGAFLPLFRQHTAIYTTRAEPWTMGEIAEDITRRYIGFRYQLMPYLYSTFFESSVNGMPVLRSLAIDYPFESRIYDDEFQQQFLFGSSIMVAPVKSNNRLAKVFLPEGEWYSLFNDSIYSGNQVLLTECPIEEIPLFVEAGSIIPAQKLIESTSEDPGDTLFVHIYKGGTKNLFTYYEDDGNTYSYLQDEYYRRDILYDNMNKCIELEAKEGSLSSVFTVINIIFHGFHPLELSNLHLDNKKPDIKIQSIRFFTSHFPFSDFGPDDTKALLGVCFKNLDEKIIIQW